MPVVIDPVKPEEEEDNVVMQEGTNKSIWAAIMDFFFSLFGGKK